MSPLQGHECSTWAPKLRDQASLDTSSAETRIREAAAMVGMTDDDRLNDLLRCMKEEYVVHAWQLPGIDSSQWKALNAPIGLAAAVRQLSLLTEQATAPLSSSFISVPSPTRSVDKSLLALGSATNYDSDAIFQDEDESVFENDNLDPLMVVPRLPGNISDVLGFPDPPSPKPAAHIGTVPPIDAYEEDTENSGDESPETDDMEDLNKSPSDDASGTLPSPESKLSRRTRKRNAALAKALMIHPPESPFAKTPPRNTPYGPYGGSPMTGTISFQEEWSEVQTILRRLSIPDQRALLCQLLIVENGATSNTRAKLVENVIVKIREVFAEGPISKDDLDLVIDHLRFFARLRSEFRKKFGKVLFAALSDLHAPTEEVTSSTEEHETNHIAQETKVSP